MNKKILIFSGLGVLVLVILVIVLLVKKEKFETGYTPSGTDNGAMVADVNGNISLTASLPIFSIIPWYPPNNTPVPNGWALCDGKQVTVLGKNISTPNLNNINTGSIRFMLGSVAPGIKGGDNSFEIASANLPMHQHNVQTKFVNNGWGDMTDFAEGNNYDNAVTWGGPVAGNETQGKIVKTEVNTTSACSGDGGGCATVPVNFTPAYITVIYIMKIA